MPAPTLELARTLALLARSLDPELRFRAVFNLGLMELRLSEASPANRQAYLAEARGGGGATS